MLPKEKGDLCKICSKFAPQYQNGSFKYHENDEGEECPGSFKTAMLFYLEDGTAVHKGDILWHPDDRAVGWYCTAEFYPNWDKETVTVRAPNGAVPTVQIKDLKKEPPPVPDTCPVCGQKWPRNTPWLYRR